MDIIWFKIVAGIQFLKALLDIIFGPLNALGPAVAIVAIALMVLAILIQVFFRYALNNALPWPDEAARFLMLWMTFGSCLTTGCTFLMQRVDKQAVRTSPSEHSTVIS